MTEETEEACAMLVECIELRKKWLFGGCGCAVCCRLSTLVHQPRGLYVGCAGGLRVLTSLQCNATHDSSPTCLIDIWVVRKGAASAAAPHCPDSIRDCV
jgi:hypothetical protein